MGYDQGVASYLLITVYDSQPSGSVLRYNATIALSLYWTQLALNLIWPVVSVGETSDFRRRADARFTALLRAPLGRNSAYRYLTHDAYGFDSHCEIFQCPRFDSPPLTSPGFDRSRYLPESPISGQSVCFYRIASGCAMLLISTVSLCSSFNHLSADPGHLSRLAGIWYLNRGDTMAASERGI